MVVIKYNKNISQPKSFPTKYHSTFSNVKISQFLLQHHAKSKFPQNHVIQNACACVYILPTTFIPHQPKFILAISYLPPHSLSQNANPPAAARGGLCCTCSTATFRLTRHRRPIACAMCACCCISPPEYNTSLQRAQARVQLFSKARARVLRGRSSELIFACTLCVHVRGAAGTAT